MTETTKRANKARIKLNKTKVDDLPNSETGQVFYWDADLLGFGIYVGKKSKTWFVEKRIQNNTRRVTLGKFPALTAEQARVDARTTLNLMAAGTDPTQKKREQRIKGVTLEEVFTEFLAARPLKPKTIKDYQGVMRNGYPDWQKKPVTGISRDMVENRHKLIGVNLH